MPTKNKIKIVAVDETGDHRTGSLPSTLSVKDIKARLGFAANCDDDESKVKYSWGFTVNGKRCGIWDYYGNRWSVYDPHNVLHLVFPEIGQ